MSYRPGGKGRETKVVQKRDERMRECILEERELEKKQNENER